jgi:hypothetical protein
MKSSPNLIFSPGFKRLLLIIAILSGAIGVKRIVESFLPPEIYKKDFIQEYLMAKAILNGVNPYLPLPELANIWMSYAGYDRLKHPTPHPPVVGLLGLPFGYLSYEQAAVVWLVFELMCLLAVILLMLRWWGKPIKAATATVLFVFALGWVPIVEDLWFGQLTICLLLLLAGAWLALREGKGLLGGALLGGMIALKLTAWPIVVFFALRRQWKAVSAAALVACAANLLAMAVIGYESVKGYYLKVGPLVGAIYRLHDTNYSTWTIGQRLFADFGYNVFIQPPWPSTLMASLFTYLVPTAVLLLGFWLASRAENFDTAFGLLIGVAILISPIAWTHYLTLAVIPLAIIARRLHALGWPRQRSYLAFCLWLFLSLAGAAYSTVTTLFASQVTSEGTPIVPFVVGLLTLMPATALIGSLWLVWRLDDIKLPQHCQAAFVIGPNEFSESGCTRAI